ncbi:Peptidase family M23 [Ekhidna lutea]|uniref:Peptidase family M23 n=1 Tax=Ekhidna lutea TaxID=447679 RepID=A0A239EWF1_EKHLU|nr:peptidoglycan DD-metalloendopeptidase family protein [Ekhidna lutea]SNS48373.1 Peptidase family M23 [Ekhidna lutea]
MRKTRIWLVITGLTIALISALYINFPITEPEEYIGEIEIDSTIFQLPTLYYGFPIDSFEVVEGRVKWSQNLSEILSAFNISFQDIHILAERSKDVYDVRKLKAGSNYSIIHDRDSLKTALQFIFEPSPAEFVVYNLKDSIYAELTQKPIKIRERSLAAEINSSLYNSILDQGASPLLVHQLVDVFAWQVDFFRIAKGDKFKLIYEEEVVDDQVIGVRSIKGAYFEHWGKPYYAIPYQAEEKVDYFDEEGNSLRKTLLRAPLNYSRISSRYSLRRFHPVQKRYKAHLGTDYAAPTGTPIRTVGDGVVLEARYHGGNGNYVKIRHNSNYTTQYLHMSKIARGIRPGTSVKQGQTIGYVGSTGLANGPHLCYRFWKNGRQVDALKVDIPSSGGIDSTQIASFKLVSDSIKTRLDGINYVAEEVLLAKIPSESEDNPTP